MKGRTLNVGLLGYAPSVGKTHGIGVETTPGLTLRGVCDLNPERLKQARLDFSGLKPYESADDLANDDDIDLVVIATAPNIHAKLALQMMAAGKHVVCEKPLALNQKETAALSEMAEKQRVHLSCHQNRRWDVDYLAIKHLLGTKGAIIGHWRDVTTYDIDPVLYFNQHAVPATEMPPDLTLHYRHHSGQVVAQKLATPPREHYVFHRNLADHLLTGEPITAPLEDSIRVVAILEAAARSAAGGGTVEVLNV